MSDETPVDALQTYRDDLRKISPPWLQRGLAEKILYSLGVHIDVFADALIAGVVQRFPGLYSFEAIGLLARERRIERGQQESDLAFADRLTHWLEAHRYRGGPYAMLQQIYLHYAPDAFDVDLVYANGRRFALDASVLDAGGTIYDAVTRDVVGWTPDADTAKWARWWLFYYTDQWAVTPPTAAELQDLRLVPRAWNAAHPLGTIVLFSSDSELWNWPPGHTWNETGTWNTSGTPLYIEVDPS